MKTFAIIVTALIPSLLFGWSINPERIETPLLDIYSKKIELLEDDEIEVPVTTFDSEGELKKNGAVHILNKAAYETFRKQADAVYQMRKSDGSRGTAFHIGENLVLTNQHVLAFNNRNNLSMCDGLKLFGSINNEKYECKKVHYCNLEHDICLIEMNPGKKFFSWTKTVMANGPSLKLKAGQLFSKDDANSMVTTAIGNSSALGIHVSQGRGTGITQRGDIFFYSPIRAGNSGGPLLNNQGLVIGVVKQESSLLVGHEAFNLATSSETMVKIIRKALKNDPETLEKFNRSVVE